MSSIEIQRSLELLKKDWEIDPLIQDFILGKTSEVSDYTVKIKDVVFHIPYLTKEKNTFYGNAIGQTVITVAIDKVDYLLHPMILFRLVLD